MLKSIQKSAKKNAQGKGGKELDIPKGNLVLQDQSNGHKKIKDHYKDQKFIMFDPHLCPNVYNIKPVYGKGLVQSVKIWDIPSKKMIHLKTLKRRVRPRCLHIIWK